MSARERVLGALRAQVLEQVPLPELRGSWIEYADPLAQFRTALERAAGTLVLTEARELARAVAALPVVRQAARCCSLVSALPGNVSAPRAPHDFQDLDVLIVSAAFCVAENGAVWLDEQLVPMRAGLFLTQHLVVLLECASIVQHLHAAYERLAHTLGNTGYGCFISGPSKTADIEQALVVGAHGPRSLTVVGY